eukprot:g24027.t1
MSSHGSKLEAQASHGQPVGKGLRSHRRRRPFLGRKYRRQRAVARKEMAVAGVLLEASFLWMRLHACMAWPHGRTCPLAQPQIVLRSYWNE